MARNTGSLTAANQTVELSTANAHRITIYLSGGSFSASLAFEGSDGTTWSALGFSAAFSTQQNSISSISLDNTVMPRSYHCDRPGVVGARIRAVSITGQLDVVIDSYEMGVAATPPSASLGGTDTVQALYLSGNANSQLTFSETAAQTGTLSAGKYAVDSSVEAWLKVGSTANNVTAGGGLHLFASNQILIDVPANERIGAIRATGTGSVTLNYHRVHA